MIEMILARSMALLASNRDEATLAIWPRRSEEHEPLAQFDDRIAQTHRARHLSS
jgi:hypothetical protein